VSFSEPAATGPTGSQLPPVTRCSSVTPGIPRSVPVSVSGRPYGRGAAGTGAWSDMTPTVNHVERRPIAERSVGAVTVSGASGVISVSRLTRPAAFLVVVASVIGPLTLSALLIVCAVTGTGPQLWYGEIVSYGSGTEIRYGRAVPVQSTLDSVSPPEVE